ncbi:exodeoxyribonuclease V subunit gamma [Rhodococcus sp. NPDC058532]|uniref:exodeoxyribonuclease V subunit gamma n=1 Tax=Rhodococcus sp. NPDC058532 TaxID=3346540 RepID=UPI0036630C2A
MLTLHRAERSDTLADALAAILAAPLADPFTREVIAVPAKGVERWLTQRLSDSLGAAPDGVDGVAANIDFPSPTRLVDEALAAASGTDADADPWHPARVLWTLLDVVDVSLDEPWAAVLARHLGHGDAGGHRIGRRYGTAAHLAELFRSYGDQRPAMLVAWAAGRDDDGAGAALAADLAWQSQLWRRLRDRIGAASPAERLGPACARIRAHPDIAGLPDRISVFGPTRLTTAQLEVLDALSANREVHLWVPHPSPTMFDALDRSVPAPTRAADTSGFEVTHPLLASLGRDVRELQARLRRDDVVHRHHPAALRPTTLLGCLQDDLAADRAPSPADCDTTIQIHACHGPARQVEVLRESLLHLFTELRDLEPRDVLIMCPDVDTYAPLIRAAFGQDGIGHPGHALRVRLADRALHQTNPVLAVLATLLDLADGRVTASEILDLAAAEPVRRRFGFSDDDLERLREWATAAGARWGIGPRERAAHGLPDFPQNTVRSALDRILLGAATDDTGGEWLGLTLPLDGVDSGDIDLTGKLAEFVDRLDVSLRGLAGPQPAPAWGAALTRALDLLVDVRERDAWQLGQAHRELAAAIEHGAADLRLADVRAMLASRLAGRPTRSNFRTGELTVCTMVPMRSVPHRVVALLGLDDEAFPRSPGVDGDNVLGRTPLPGERDPRSEDRQLLLDAIGAAGERLLLFYTGMDPVSGVTRPPAIPLSEVRDVLDAMVGRPAAVVTTHPLQPFDARNFRGPRPFSFDTAALAGAMSAQRPAAPDRGFLPEPLPALAPGDVDLAELIAFVVHPTQGFLRQRLGVRIADLDEEIADALDLELDSLARWSIGERMLTAILADDRDFPTAVADFRAAEWRRGTLPPAALGGRALEDIEEAVRVLASAGRMPGRPGTVDVDLDLGDGRRLTGSVDGVHEDVVARTTFSKLGPKHRLTAWVQLLALSAAQPDRRWRADTIGKGPVRRPTAWRSHLVAPADARAQLDSLITLRDSGLRAPLPIATAATAAYAARRAYGDAVESALDSAANEWGSAFGDGKDRHVTYLYGADAPLTVLTATRASGTEGTRFGDLARALWEPLLAAETMGAS